MTTQDLLVPWSFLGGFDDNTSSTTLPKPTFAQTVRGATTDSIPHLPQPCIKGDVVAVKIPEAAYQAGLQRCKTHLHGRLILAKGDKPTKFVELKSKLKDLWSMVGKWDMLSLGRGFYEFSFSSVEDMRLICATGSWNLRPGLLRLSLWTPDFNPELQKATHSQCWVKISGLPQEYWCASIILSIAGGIGTPIALDEATKNRAFGHFARALVEVNLTITAPTKILVERDGFKFFVDVEVENRPAFCSGCQAIGHVVSNCRRLLKEVVEEVAKPRKVVELDNTMGGTTQVVEPSSFNLFIDLEIDRNKEIEMEGMEKFFLNREVPNSEVSGEKVGDREIPTIEGSGENFKVTEELNPMVARDMAIVGRLWAEDEVGEVEEDPFTVVLSKSQQKRKMKKMHSQRIHFAPEPMIDFEEVNPSFWSALNLRWFGSNDRGSLKPNLWGLCRRELNPSVIASSAQHISTTVEVENKSLFVNVVYAHNNYMVRRQLWADIQAVMDDNQGPWCCLGDFNVVLGAHECRGPNLPPRMPSEEFKLFSDAGNLIHLMTRGAEFTWTNRRRGAAATEKRLDRCLANENCLSTWNQFSCSTLPRIASDHHPLLLSCSSGTTRSSAFKFHNMWLEHGDCRRLVEENWSLEVVGCPMFVLSHKLKLLKQKLKVWNIQVFGNIHERVKRALANVAAIQEDITLRGQVEELLNQEQLAQSELLLALDVEEKFWKEKARISWHSNGDRNTSFFHKLTKVRQATRALASLRDGENILVDQDAISQHVLGYFTDIYASPSEAVPNLLIQSVIPALGLKTNLLALNSLIKDYANASGQHANLPKCRFYTCSVNSRRIHQIADLLGFSQGNLPFSYLGVPLFKGKPRRLHLQPIADRIIAKLASWKGLSLSIIGRVELVKSVIHSMVAYSFHIYAWPSSLIKSLEVCIRNFIWSGNTNTKKIVTVAWAKVCSPIKAGGLGMRNVARFENKLIAVLQAKSRIKVTLRYNRCVIYGDVDVIVMLLPRL
ncbi:hypothetical protein Lal_00016795 [Lupinus albus]|nr:hypothetical protein Lal_00016795 [Lupinus albus]